MPTVSLPKATTAKRVRVQASEILPLGKSLAISAGGCGYRVFDWPPKAGGWRSFVLLEYLKWAEGKDENDAAMVRLPNHPSLVGGNGSPSLREHSPPARFSALSFSSPLALSMNTRESYCKGQRHPIVYPYPHGSSLGFHEDLDPSWNFEEDSVSEDGSLVGTTLSFLSGIHLSDQIFRSSASFLNGEDSPLVDGDWISGEGGSEMDNDEWDS
jgi:hypothetical protein